MLSRIFGSESKIKILDLFFSSPEKEFKIKELSTSLELKPAILKRELNSFLEEGLIVKKELNSEEALQETEEKKVVKKTKTTTKKKVELVYFVNKEHLLSEEIKQLLSKAKILNVEKTFIDLAKDSHIKLLILTGRFTNQENLPIDLLLVGNPSRKWLTSLIEDLQNNLSWEINYTILSLDEFKYRQDVMDVFLFDIMGSNKIVLVDNINNENKKGKD